uniref:Uncharacterized protein n=1 Tax=Arundo donax TaxID=35708 RepID=A0A0A8YPU2_ARUDO
MSAMNMFGYVWGHLLVSRGQKAGERKFRFTNMLTSGVVVRPSNHPFLTRNFK